MRPETGDFMDTPSFHMTRRLIFLLACACGAAVSNICYAQPLLEQIRASLGSSAAAAGMVSTLTTVGYTVGLLFLVPLGDVWRRRRLIVGLMIVEAVFLAGAALSPSLAALQIASVGIGVASVSAQLVIPLVAQLSEPEKRGQNVGTVMSGVLLGILLARVLAGAIGGEFGWRVMFWLACGIAVLFAIVLERTLPDVPPTAELQLRDLMGSLWSLVKEEPELRQSALIGGMMFATFLGFWTSISFHLEGAPFHYSTQIVGLFGLVGAAGAMMAPIAGKLADARGPRAVIGLSTALTAASFGLFWLFGTNVWALVFCIALMDAGVQATQISNQTRIFVLRPEARSRINTVFMVACFIGASIGSFCSNLAWSQFGWAGVCATGLLFSSAAWVTHVAYGLKSGVLAASRT